MQVINAKTPSENGWLEFFFLCILLWQFYLQWYVQKVQIVVIWTLFSYLLSWLTTYSVLSHDFICFLYWQPGSFVVRIKAWWTFSRKSVWNWGFKPSVIKWRLICFLFVFTFTLNSYCCTGAFRLELLIHMMMGGRSCWGWVKSAITICDI